MRDPLKGSRHIHTTTRPLLRWSSLFSHMPRPFRRLLQFAHWIRHDAMMDVPSFLKKLDDMLPADDYSPNAGVDEGADHADDRAVGTNHRKGRGVMDANSIIWVCAIICAACRLALSLIAFR